MTDQFPYVQACPYCDGAGWKWISDSEIMSFDGGTIRRFTKRAACDHCDGRGKVIPPEWTQT
jgi:DnaJ-class molecular chaperone